MKANDEAQHNWKLERNSLDLISSNLLALFHNSFVLKPHFFRFIRVYFYSFVRCSDSNDMNKHKKKKGGKNDVKN